jgi:uncharacterized protein (DUF952 family)
MVSCIATINFSCKFILNDSRRAHLYFLTITEQLVLRKSYFVLLINNIEFMSNIIYHITRKEEWIIAQVNDYYVAPSLAIEGFIHCSTANQVQGVLERYFAGKTNLVKLVIDTTLLTNELKYELAPSVNEQFPHVFGTINLDAVVEVVEI